MVERDQDYIDRGKWFEYFVTLHFEKTIQRGFALGKKFIRKVLFYRLSFILQKEIVNRSFFFNETINKRKQLSNVLLLLK